MPPFIEHAKAHDAEPESTNGVAMVFDPEEQMMVPAIDLAQRGLKLPQLKRVINYSAEQPRFALELDDGRRLPIGGTPQLRKVAVITDVLAEATNEYPPAMTEAKYRPIANALRALAELEDDGASPSDETWVWLAKFCQHRLLATLDLGTDEGRTEATGDRKNGIKAKDGHLYVDSHELHGYAKSNRLAADLSLANVTQRLRDLGFEKVTITAPRRDDGSGKRTQPQRVYWRSPEPWTGG